MTPNPYADRPASTFWRSGVAEISPLELRDIYRKRWDIDPDWKIATAGSCFAQHIARYMGRAGFSVLDVEPKPNGLPDARAQAFGYQTYSARYGNIYTARQLLQLLREATQGTRPDDLVWDRDGRFYDSQRPGIEPHGFDSAAELLDHRAYHIQQVRQMVQDMDLFIFTLGLTETWEHRDSGTVFPTAPGTLAGTYDPARYRFRNFTFPEVHSDLTQVLALLDEVRDRPLHVLLTVSPVPLTATGDDRHVLQASTYSKSVLRAVAGQICAEHDRVDYFPSYEIVTNPAARGVFYAPNLRSVTSAGVDVVMKSFFGQHGSAGDANATPAAPPQDDGDGDELVCEEAMLEAFGE